MNVSQIIESSVAGGFRADEDRQSQTVSDVGDAAIMTGAATIGAVDKGLEIGADIIGLGE
jgi:hypothetical protein